MMLEKKNNIALIHLNLMMKVVSANILEQIECTKNGSKKNSKKTCFEDSRCVFTFLLLF